MVTSKTIEKLETGAKAPVFSLLDQDEANIKSSAYKGKKILLYFYPRASTPGCTVQACSLRDSMKSFNDLEVEVIGISPDLPAKLKKFDEKQQLGFRLLSDPEMKVAKSYKVVGEKTMFGKKKIGIIRSSFLIDEKGRILNTWYKVKSAETVPLAMEFLSEL